MNLWIKKLQQANSIVSRIYVPMGMYKDIIDNVEFAFRKDHNLIVEEYDFYQQLSPKMQTEVIDTIFMQFMQNFRFFFDPLDRGFVNEVIIQLFARKYEVGNDKRLRLEKPEYKMTQMYFILEGGFGLYNPAIKQKGTHENNNPFVVMKRNSIYGDYQLAFDLYPMMEFSPYVMNNETPQEVASQLGEDAELTTFNVMCLDGEKFLELCELYEESFKTI